MNRGVFGRHRAPRRLAVLMLVASVGISTAEAQEPVLASLDPTRPIHHYVHETWTMEDGLPSNTIRDIVQTRDGYLWLATHGGLVRFDGVRFETFDAANTPALQTSLLVQLLEGHDGTLWNGSDGGGLVRYRDGAFSALTRADGLAGRRHRSILKGDRQTAADQCRSRCGLAPNG